MLAKGGPVGAYLWGHLHAIHSDRTGETSYAAVATIRGDDGYLFNISPVIVETISGVLDKPERHSHCYLQFVLPESDQREWLKEAVENGTHLNIRVDGDRDRNDIDWASSALKDILTEVVKELLEDYVTGSASVIDVLKAVNNNQPPAFKRLKQ
ncbi:hypothetical protein [Priestia megaterium]|uniref:hypothetical protein n=1 Tax=Priestia megaterium TaxID=1404 RepID=UPI0012B9FFFF|nr:hypothetical protein [Priestia megaterium]